ncbi:hypothetical protein HAX54_001661, partial [Datura stramonium]|nr:hypothetical protein [Datura stramonium]
IVVLWDRHVYRHRSEKALPSAIDTLESTLALEWSTYGQDTAYHETSIHTLDPTAYKSHAKISSWVSNSELPNLLDTSKSNGHLQCLLGV